MILNDLELTFNAIMSLCEFLLDSLLTSRVE